MIFKKKQRTKMEEIRAKATIGRQNKKFWVAKVSKKKKSRSGMMMKNLLFLIS